MQNSDGGCRQWVLHYPTFETAKHPVSSRLTYNEITETGVFRFGFALEVVDKEKSRWAKPPVIWQLTGANLLSKSYDICDFGFMYLAKTKLCNLV